MEADKVCKIVYGWVVLELPTSFIKLATRGISGAVISNTNIPFCVLLVILLNLLNYTTYVLYKSKYLVPFKIVTLLIFAIPVYFSNIYFNHYSFNLVIVYGLLITCTIGILVFYKI